MGPKGILDFERDKQTTRENESSKDGSGPTTERGKILCKK